MNKEEKNIKYHEWVGERCWKCGDKDWMASSECSEIKVTKEKFDNLINSDDE